MTRISNQQRIAAEAMNEARARHAFDRMMVGRAYDDSGTAEAWLWFIAGYRASELDYFTVADDKRALTEKLYCADTLRDALKDFLE